jgi:hypothetical protein
MKKILFTLVLLSSILYSQNGSIYSNFGIGELNVNPTTRRSGFGLGVAVADNFDINPFNIASNSKIQFVKFAASMSYVYNNYSDAISKNRYVSSSFENLLIALPIQRDYGIVLSGGISPFTKVNFKVLTPDIYFDTIPYQVKYESSGGITNYFFGVSYNWKNIGSLGLSSNFLVGTINRKISTEISNSSVNPVFTKEYQYKGTTFRFGFISENLVKYFESLPFKDLRFGFSYLLPTRLKGELLQTKQGIFIDTVKQVNQSFDLSGQLIAGLSAKLNNRLSLMVDYLNQDWTKLGTNQLSNYTLTNQNYISLGVEYLPDVRPERFSDAITWRGGIFMKDIGISVNGEKIREYGIKTGLSLPIDQLNLIDVGIQYSIRGKKENNLIKESVFNFTFGINFAEIWFVRNEE